MSHNTDSPPQGIPYGQQQYGYGAQPNQSQVAYAHQQPQAQPAFHQQQQQPHAGPVPRFAHLANMPFFVLSDAKAAELAQHNAQQAAIFHDYCLGALKPEPQLTPMEKVGKLALEVTTGVDLINPDKVINNAFKFAMAVNHLAVLDAQGTEHMILARWTMLPVQAGGRPLVVDVLEHFRTRVKWVGRNIVVKANRPVEVKVRGKYTANLQKNKDLKRPWTKIFNNKPVDTMAVIVDGKDIPLELVLRVKRVVTSSEQTPIYTRFWKEWLVPN